MTKQKSIFDHIDQIKFQKSKDYVDKLTESEIKGFSKYVILMGLSMDQNIISNIAFISKYMDVLPIKQFYEVCCDLTPKLKSYNKWVKSKKPKLNLELSNILASHFKTSRHEVREYYAILIQTDDGIKELVDICTSYGYSEKETETLLSVEK